MKNLCDNNTIIKIEYEVRTNVESQKSHFFFFLESTFVPPDVRASTYSVVEFERSSLDGHSFGQTLSKVNVDDITPFLLLL